MKLVVWGAGGHGAVVMDAIQREKIHEPIGFLDDKDNGEGRLHRCGLPILYGRQNLSRLRADGIEGIVIAIGEEAARTAIAKVAVEAGFELCAVVHPGAIVCPNARIGAGTVVFAGAVVQTGSEIGTNVIINTCASIDHDCRIGNGAQLAPRATLGGRVEVGDLTFIGIGTTIINRIKIGRNCVIGAGAVVVRDIPDHSVAYGVPARVVRHREPV
jgi:UDP-N-acetylbacillosamine N-acetyltransferase